MSQEQINHSYYCQRCRGAFMTVITDNNGSSVPKIRTFKNGFEGRFLTCGHAVNVQDAPVHISSESKVNMDSNTQVDPAELRTINLQLTMEVSKMSDEQLENHIQFHVAEYKLHLMATKKAKYSVQMLEDLVQKRIDSLKANTEQEQQLKRNMEVKFGYLFRKPEKRLELIAKDKATADRKEAKKEVSKDDAMARLREMMRKSGLTKDDLK